MSEMISGRPPIQSDKTQQVAGTVAVSGITSVQSALYKLAYEEASSTITYIGEAVAGTATSAASWRIKRMDTSSGIIILWANSVTTFTNIWDNRAALSYS